MEKKRQFSHDEPNLVKPSSFSFSFYEKWILKIFIFKNAVTTVSMISSLLAIYLYICVCIHYIVLILISENISIAYVLSYFPKITDTPKKHRLHDGCSYPARRKEKTL